MDAPQLQDHKAMNANNISTAYATTYGIELTFMPTMFDQLFISTRGAFQGWDHYNESSVREMLRNAFTSEWERRFPNFKTNKKGAKKKNPRRHRLNNIGTDPSCIEISTLPFNGRQQLSQCIRDVYAVAHCVQLSPTALWTGGGGAHIHSGIPYASGTNEYRAYMAAMLCFGVNNPWMAWAFIHRNDHKNAQAICGEAIYGNSDTIYCEHAQRLYNDVAVHRRRLEAAIRDLHKKEVWEDEHNARWDARYTVDRSRSYYNISRLRWHKYATRVAQAMSDDLDYARGTAENMVGVTLFSTKDAMTKANFMRQAGYGDNGTVEFRCFLMTDSAKDMQQHIDLVDAIVRQCKDFAESGATRIARPVARTYDELRAMKYSEAKQGFNSMLQQLNLDPEDYRQNRVNIALRMRARRAYNYV